MDVEPLRKLGLTEGEIKVYIALVRLGETSSGPIVEQSGVSVSKVYTILDRLAQKGLAAHVLRQKTKYFRAADPQRLLSYLREQQDDLKHQETKLKTLVTELSPLTGTAFTGDMVQVYDGLRGIQTARERTLTIMKKGEQMWIVGIARTPYDRLTPYFEEYHSRRCHKGIRCRYLYDEYARTPFGEKSATYPFSEVRYLPPSMITHAWMEIYADTVTIGINKSSSFSVVIQNQEVADSFRIYAELLWKQGRV